MQKKRMMAVVVAAIMALSTLSVSAEWLCAGYDTTNLADIGKIYNEVIGGAFTGNVKIDPLPVEDIEWKAEGFELAYPHAGYDRLYLEGVAQNVTKYNNKFPQWETRFVDYFWEVAGDHMIYQRQQTNIPGKGWTWDFSEDEVVDASLCVRTNRKAEVVDSFKVYGVGPFNMEGNVICDPEILAMYDRFGVNNEIFEIIPDTKDIVDYSFFSEENLSVKDYNGQYVVSDEEIAAHAGSIVSKFVTGPSFRGDEPTKDVAAMYLDMKNPEKWAWDWDTVKYGGAKIEWTAPTFEMQEPYKMYQYLIINGLVFDGRADLPVIYRYTGGVASPKVEWKYAFAEKAHPHAVIEFKYVNGKLALDANGDPIYRVPTGEYAKAYAKVNDNYVSIYLKDANGDVEIASVPRYGTIGGYNGYVGGGYNVAY